MVELHYQTFSLSALGRVTKSLIVDDQKPYNDAVEKLKNNIIKFNTSLDDTALLVNIGQLSACFNVLPFTKTRLDTNVTGHHTKALVQQLSSREAGRRLPPNFSIVKLMELDDRMDKVLEWLSPGNLSRTHQVLAKERVDNSGHWFLASQKFQYWASGEGYEFLFCPGRGTKLRLKMM